MGWKELGASVFEPIIDFGSSRYHSKRQEKFQRNMSNTAYQRSMADMRKAGLNPILMSAQYGGASTPGGSAGHSLNTDLTEGVNTALQAKRLNADIQQINSQVNLNKSLEKESQERAKYHSSSAKQVDVNTHLLRNQLPASGTRGKIDASLLGQGLTTAKHVGGSAGAAIAGVGFWALVKKYGFKIAKILTLKRP